MKRDSNVCEANQVLSPVINQTSIESGLACKSPRNSLSTKWFSSRFVIEQRNFHPKRATQCGNHSFYLCRQFVERAIDCKTSWSLTKQVIVKRNRGRYQFMTPSCKLNNRPTEFTTIEVCTTSDTTSGWMQSSWFTAMTFVMTLQCLRRWQSFESSLANRAHRKRAVDGEL